MATPVIMPKVDMDQETGTVIEWLKQDGDTVEKGESILVIETNKVAIEVEAPASGILGGIKAEPGQVIPIAMTIAFILEHGEELPGGTAPAEPTAQHVIPAALTPTTSRVAATPVARNLAAASGIDLAAIAGTGPRGKVTKADVETALAAPYTADGAAPGRVFATPAARRIARERIIALPAVSGSGPNGRIQAADVLSAAARPDLAAVLATGAAPTPEVEVIPLQGIRRTIAERMTASYRTAPHITFTSRVDMTRFDEALAELNARTEAADGGRISATTVIVKAVAETLTRHPWLNSSLHGEEIHLRRDINIGVAVAMETGLIVPVVHNADRKGVVHIATEINDLATRAREGQLVPHDVSDGTFTISNLGPFGVEQFTAIINSPQAAILAVGAIQLEAVPDANGQILARPIMRMTLSADHRVIDGVIAARFIADLKTALEAPTLILW